MSISLSKRLVSLAFVGLQFITSIALALRILGANPSDLRSIWLYQTDLMSWYSRAVALYRGESPGWTRALGFPGTLEFPSASFVSLDAVQWLLVKVLADLTRDPVWATNAWIMLSIGASGVLMQCLLRLCAIPSLIAFAGGLAAALAPFTWAHIANPNVAFTWPYSLALILLLSAATSKSQSRARPGWLFLGGLILSGAGVYPVAFTAIVLIPPALLMFWRLRSVLNPRSSLLTRVLPIAGFIVGLCAQLLEYQWRAGQVMGPQRVFSEAVYWQGWNVSQFLPTWLSGLPPVAQVGAQVQAQIYEALDPSSVCLGMASTRDMLMTLYCSGVNENLAYPSVLMLFGAAVSVAYAVVNLRARSRNTDWSGKQPLSALLLAVSASAFLWSLLVGSFGLGLIATWAVPSLRAWGRLFGLTSILAIAVVAVILAGLVASLTRLSGRLVSLSLLVLVVTDQAGYQLDAISKHAPSEQNYQALAWQAKQLSGECAFVVLPSRQFLFDDVIPASPDYHPNRDEVFAAYSPDQRWSGGTPGDIADQQSLWPLRQSVISPAAADDVLARSASAGVCGFVFDTSSGSASASAYTRSLLQAAANRSGLGSRLYTFGPLSLLVLTDRATWPE